VKEAELILPLESQLRNKRLQL
jgi:hypothetical protein